MSQYPPPRIARTGRPAAIAAVGDLAEDMENGVHLDVVVLADAMQRHQGLEHDDVDLVFGDGVKDLGDGGVIDDQRAVAAGDLDGEIALSGDEQPADQFALGDSVVPADGGDPALHLLGVVVAVMDPYAAALGRLFADHPELARPGLIALPWAPPKLDAVKIAKGTALIYPIKDFYLTNPIARSSPTLQRCSAEILHGETWAEAAE